MRVLHLRQLRACALQFGDQRMTVRLRGAGGRLRGVAGDGRTRVARLFPNVASCLRLVTAVTIEISGLARWESLPEYGAGRDGIIDHANVRMANLQKGCCLIASPGIPPATGIRPSIDHECGKPGKASSLFQHEIGCR